MLAASCCVLWGPVLEGEKQGGGGEGGVVRSRSKALTPCRPRATSHLTRSFVITTFYFFFTPCLVYIPAMSVLLLPMVSWTFLTLLARTGTPVRAHGRATTSLGKTSSNIPILKLATRCGSRKYANPWKSAWGKRAGKQTMWRTRKRGWRRRKNSVRRETTTVITRVAEARSGEARVGITGDDGGRL